MKKLISAAFLFVILAAPQAQASEALKGLKKDFASVKSKVKSEVETAREKIEDEIAEAKGEKNGIWGKIKLTLSDTFNSLNSKLQKALKD